MSEVLPFYALSYTWEPAIVGSKIGRNVCEVFILQRSGSFVSTENLKKNSSPQRSVPTGDEVKSYVPINVTSNLSDALKTLATLENDQRLKEGSLLWIDALSINQLDNDEKAGQILLMTDIFSKAHAVIVWLGSDISDIDTLLWLNSNALPALRTKQKEKGDHWLRQHSPTDADMWKNSIEVSPGDTSWDQRWQSFFRFYQRRRWFTRAWVAQEFALAKRISVLCGDKLMSWAQISDLAEIVFAIGWDSIQPTTITDDPKAFRQLDASYTLFELNYTRNLVQCENPATSPLTRGIFAMDRPETPMQMWSSILSRILDSVRRRNCSVPVDKVFSILGIVQEMLPQDSQTKLSFALSANKGEIYTWITNLVLQNSRTLNILAFKEPISKNDKPDMPSWVPDFNADAWPFPISSIAHFDAASVWSSPYTPPAIYEGAICVRGANISTVTTAGQPTTTKCEYLQNCLKIATDMDLIYHKTGQDRTSVLWRTLILDVWGHAGKYHPGSEQLGVAFRKLLIKTFSEQMVRLQSKPQDREKFEEEISSLLDSFNNSQNKRRYIPSSRAFRMNSAKILVITPKESVVFDKDHVRDLTKMIHQWKSHRVLFCTSTGLIGLGPAGLSLQDEVWLIEGGRTPYILRQRDSKGNYEYIGECYVHGIMHGELMTEEMKGRFSSISII